jgi:hypothetical protein
MIGGAPRPRRNSRRKKLRSRFTVAALYRRHDAHAPPSRGRYADTAGSDNMPPRPPSIEECAPSADACGYWSAPTTKMTLTTVPGSGCRVMVTRWKRTGEPSTHIAIPAVLRLNRVQ